MIILKSSLSEELKVGIEIIESFSDFADACELYSVLCDIRFQIEFSAPHNFEDFVNHKVFMHKEVQHRTAVINKSANIKIVKVWQDSLEPLREHCPDVNSRETILDIISASILKAMGLKDKVEVIQENDFWHGSNYDQFTIVNKKPKIISIFDAKGNGR